MAQEQCGNIDPSLRQIVDGFAALSDEYKHLAEQHRVLQSNLSAATDELASFKERYSDRLPAEELKSKRRDPGAIERKTRRSLTDWLAEIRSSESSDVQEAITRVREAELACFGIRNHVDGIGPGSDAHYPASMRTGSKSARNRVRMADARDIELDFTTNGKAGRLGCPFAQRSGNNRLAHSQPHDLPTPRSSGSHYGRIAKGPKRMSFNDPIRPKIHASEIPSPVPSEPGSNGPACPIRFLGNHPPEEVAKYFEEHKHEIPRSHEVCVKRFQMNADTIRELDAKYGNNLPNMIKGLGEKHQPMLPETPDHGEGGPTSEEAKSNQKVKSWAEGIGAAQVDEGEGTGAANPTAGAQSDIAGGEERVSHFDRPLKEIRVGESPSRPWGVPIPSKYLDRAGSPDRLSTCAAANDEPPAVPTIKVEEEATKSKAAADLVAAREAVPLPRHQKKKMEEGKCPFDHKALAAAKAKPIPDAAAAPKLSGSEAPRGNTGDTAPQLQTEERNENLAGHAVNRGLAFIADMKHFYGNQFENHGTMFLGYSVAEAQDVLGNATQNAAAQR